VFNVGSDEQNHRLVDVAQLIAELVPGVRVRFEAAAAEEANYRVSFAHIRSALGFTPSRSLADGIAEVKAAVERGQVGDYQDAKYSNFKAMTTGQAARALDDGQQAAPTAAVG
jgi:hypothetical protein